MNLEILSALEGLLVKDPAGLAGALTRLLTEKMQSQPVTIKSARDKLREINRRAREGQMQVIKGAPGQETIIVSLRDLAAMVQAARTGVSLADAFEATGFRPVKGRRQVVEEGLGAGTELVMPNRHAKEKQFEAAAV